MMKKRMVFICCAISLLAVSGCLGGKAYLIDKERVDQEVPGEPESSNRVKTRKVLVIEFVERNKNVVTSPAMTTTSTTESQDAARRVVTKSQDTVIVCESHFTPSSMETAAVPAKTNEAVVPGCGAVYVVQKDDTLQKIAKKCYGVFGQWMRIYDANRDVIKNPDALRSGITLKMPPQEAPANHMQSNISTKK